MTISPEGFFQTWEAPACLPENYYLCFYLDIVFFELIKASTKNCDKKHGAHFTMHCCRRVLTNSNKIWLMMIGMVKMMMKVWGRPLNGLLEAEVVYYPRQPTLFSITSLSHIYCCTLHIFTIYVWEYISSITSLSHIYICIYCIFNVYHVVHCNILQVS